MPSPVETPYRVKDFFKTKRHNFQTFKVGRVKNLLIKKTKKCTEKMKTTK